MPNRLTIKQLRTLHVGPLDLTVAGGECVVLAGASGAGKTLLLRAIADLDPHSGEVFLGEVPCSAITGHLWRRRVGLLPAESHWWGESVGEHFAHVDEAGLAELGFGSEVMGWEVARCSTGERQRLALLRLLQNRPEVLLLDEPTASLDAENVGRVEALLLRLCRERGMPMLWVSHDAEQANRVASRRYNMRGGRFEEVA
ncbi:MAG: ABC transporter ATP-binding protein [Pseudomonadota bacterium]